MDSREAFIALNLIEGVGSVRARSLLEHFGDAPSILTASQAKLLRVRNIGADTAEKIAKWEKTIDLAAELKRISNYGCHVLIQSDENYPAALREIYDPPLVIYVRGNLTPKDKNAVGMVGSRMTTHYGIETARKLAKHVFATHIKDLRPWGPALVLCDKYSLHPADAAILHRPKLPTWTCSRR